MTDPIPYATVERRGITARDLFGVVVRTIGLLLLMWGAYSILYVGLMSLGMLNGGYSRANLISWGIMLVVVGAAFLRGEWVVWLAYGTQR